MAVKKYKVMNYEATFNTRKLYLPNLKFLAIYNTKNVLSTYYFIACHFFNITLW